MNLLYAYSGFGGVVYKTDKWGWKDCQLLRALATPAEDSGLAASTDMEAHKQE